MGKSLSKQTHIFLLVLVYKWLFIEKFKHFNLLKREFCWKHFFCISSGLTIYGNYKVEELNQITSTSNTILLYFYSDLAYNMSGFNISYRYVISIIYFFGRLFQSTKSK